MKPNTVLAALLLLSGSTQVWAAPAPVSEAANNPNSGSVEQRIAQLERMMKTRNLLQIELQQQLNLLQDEVSQVRGVTEEQSYKLEKVLQRQRELYQEIENRVSKVYEQTSTASVSPAEVDATQAISSNLSENEAYDRAVALIMQDKRYDAAIPEFQSFLTTFPQSVYIPNAHYWLGQLLSIKNDDGNALVHFKMVVEQFPDSNKRPDAMLKLGALYEKQEKLDLAKQILNTLISEYPSTTAAKLATERLAKI
ncbi:Cell division coordinator CpoB [Pseudoalteromonas holothuriae]|uniref:Cell division coordinator CpoB n=1 Tax=Pseudoalteromonas holothuriae TaxID=2963714 RepID=A0A9W4VN74_9GAMM|nr:MULTISPECIES: tol-pal system protein YbgF [unclassified Pseudoalteromonas]CAH9051654.1 Cell division coordinator CpoB [Pseudoalteromonas sp. CIP111854]CAH9057162.1 Cell division coordinator CpoB [Pseudoalteromonas sp. CIP111951]